MNLRWFAATATVMIIGFGLGCANGIQPSPSGAPTLDTLRAALAEHNDLERKYLLTSFLRSLRPKDMPAVIAEVEKHRTGFGTDDVRLLMLAWTRFDGPGAFAAARDWPTPWKTVLMKEAMEAWGFSDGRAAHAQCEKIEDEELREILCSKVVDGWVTSSDGLGAAEYAATVKEPRRRRRLAFRLIGNAKRDGPDAIIALAEGVPEDAPNHFKAHIFFHAAGALARLDPERVIAWYERHMKDPYSAGSLGNIATKWSDDGQSGSAIPWIESLDLEESRQAERVDAIGKAFKSWHAHAPADATAWLGSTSAGPGRDRAIEELAKAIGEGSPAEALAWVRQIENKDLRRRRMFRYTRHWFLRDPSALKTWIAESDLSSDTKQELQNNLPRLSVTKKGRRAAKEKRRKRQGGASGPGGKKAGSGQ